MTRPSRRPPLALLGLLSLLPASPVVGQEAGDSLGPSASAEVEASVSHAWGPLRLEERNPFVRLYLTPVTEGTELAAAGEVWADVRASYSNIFEFDLSPTHHVLFDLERLTSTVAVRFGLSDRVEAGITLATQTSWGGFLDPFIQSLHRTLGFPNADREKFPDGHYHARVTDLRFPRSVVSLPSGTQLEDPRVHLALRLGGGPESPWAWTLRATGKVPLGRRAIGTGRADVAFELAGRRSFGGTHVHAQGGVVRPGAPAVLNPYTREWAGVGSLALEQRLTDGLSAIVQLRGGTGYLKNFGSSELDGRPLDLAFGLAGGSVTGWSWQAGFAEDLRSDGPSVDFTFDLRVSRRW